jgi:hypothetical protein
MAAVWTQGFADDAFADRGTGYNYFDGTSWGEIPSARIENIRTGWPSYAPLGDGEMVISHKSTGLVFTSRPTRGTGAWTTVNIPGTTNYAWPRAITNGNTIHLIVNTYVLYQGLEKAIVYLRSTDAGATWSTPTILPGMDAASFVLKSYFKGFDGDEYAWAAPKGDTIAFGFGNFLGGLWVMKSFDNGDTWTRTTVYEFPNVSGSESPQFSTYDEHFALALDNLGKIHLATTRYGIYSFDSTLAQWYPYSSNYTYDGIVYWNETMPKLDSAIFNNPDSLKNHGLWLGEMVDVDNSDSIELQDAGINNDPWGAYRYAGRSSFPQIVIDNNNNMYVSYSSLREDLFNSSSTPFVQHYRHLYVTSKLNGQSEWSVPIDLNNSVEHNYDEFVWGNMIIGYDGQLHFLCQVDAEPGTAVVTVANGGDGDLYGDNYIYHLTFPTFVNVKPVDIARDVLVSPNPASDFTNVNITLADSRKVELHVFDAMGKLVVNTDLGELSSGNHTIKVSTALLPAGIYLFNVQAGTSQTTKKVIVK